jgi:hypothetical protein
MVKGSPELWVYEDPAGLAIYVSASAFSTKGEWAFKHVGTVKWTTVRAALKRRDARLKAGSDGNR